MSERFESKIVTYTALLSHQQRTKKRDTNSHDIRGEVLGVREQKANNGKSQVIFTIKADLQMSQAVNLVNKTVTISKGRRNPRK